jgi:hypothetical protein
MSDDKVGYCRPAGEHPVSRREDSARLLLSHAPDGETRGSRRGRAAGLLGPGEIVLDAFLGSGTTLLAAQGVGRVCYRIELEPKYVDLAVRRWQSMTREDAVDQSTGRTFNETEESEAEHG